MDEFRIVIIAGDVIQIFGTRQRNLQLFFLQTIKVVSRYDMYEVWTRHFHRILTQQMRQVINLAISNLFSSTTNNCDFSPFSTMPSWPLMNSAIDSSVSLSNWMVLESALFTCSRKRDKLRKNKSISQLKSVTYDGETRNAWSGRFSFLFASTIAK